MRTLIALLAIGIATPAVAGGFNNFQFRGGNFYQTFKVPKKATGIKRLPRVTKRRARSGYVFGAGVRTGITGPKANPTVRKPLRGLPPGF